MSIELRVESIEVKDTVYHEVQMLCGENWVPMSRNGIRLRFKREDMAILEKEALETTYL